jgi:hypothetical protein
MELPGNIKAAEVDRNGGVDNLDAEPTHWTSLAYKQ